MSLRRIQERQLLQVRYKKFPVRLLESASIPVLTSADLDRSLRACGMEWLSGRVWPPHVLRGPPASLRGRGGWTQALLEPRKQLEPSFCAILRSCFTGGTTQHQ